MIGYDFLSHQLASGAFEQKRPARVRPVTRVTELGDYLAVPAWVAPKTQDPLEHLQFALKHEGMNLQAALLALKHIDANAVAAEFQKSPSSGYARLIGYLWELANKRVLEGLGEAAGGYVPVFDPEEFVTGPITHRSARWRVNFNGLGTTSYCATVKRNPEVAGLLQEDILGKTTEFIETLDKGLLDRAVHWAYLSETEGSFAIERETPTHSKAETFAKLLAQAHKPESVTEEYLVALQNLTVSNPIDKAIEFRNRQNWLKNTLRGAAGITYLPPDPELLTSIMDGVMALANDQTAVDGIDPLVRGSLVSFGFVFAHPFMDGNGRLSRFLFHKAVCSTGKLPDGLVLPVSVAMKRNEGQYLSALESFSKSARSNWEVLAISETEYDTKFKGDPDVYRYWDATECVSFGLKMAKEALDHDLRKESDFLQTYDRVYRAVDASVDMNNNDLTILIRSGLQNGGIISNNRMKQMIAKGHPVEIVQAIQEIMKECLQSDDPQAPLQAPRPT